MAQPTKHELIESIRRLNPTAGRRFLGRFTPRQLADYLAHLQTTRVRGDRLAGGWVERRVA